MAIPWGEIEREYITTEISQRKIAEKYKTTAVSVNAHAKAGNWGQKREAYIASLNGGQPIAQKSLGIFETEIIPGEGYFVLELGPDAEGMKPRQRYQLYSSLLKKIPSIDKDDPEQVKNRIESYFDFCSRNDIATSPPDLARWLKTTTERLRRWRNGEYRKATHQKLIEDAWTKLESDLVNRIQTNSINPGSGIFLLKNWMGYKDVQDVVIAPKNPLGDLKDPEELRRRIEGAVIDEDGG